MRPENDRVLKESHRIKGKLQQSKYPTDPKDKNSLADALANLISAV